MPSAYKNHNKIVSSLVAMLGVAMLFVVLFSSIYVATESLHDCTGDECPICTMLHQCENNLNQLGDGRVHLAIAIFIATFMSLMVSLPGDHHIYPTLVSNMVRLNN